MKFAATAMASATMVALTNAHGFILSPKPRMPGATMEAACGQQVYYNQMGDNYGNVQGMLQVANSQTDYNAAACKIWMCKGYKYADNTANVQKYTPGQTIPITVDIRAPHTGVANVSIVATANNKMISSELISWTNYASNAATIPAGQKQFNIVMPSNLGSQCNNPGACVIQWFWDAADINQTYESCIDFTLSGSGSGSANTKVATTPAATSPAKTTVVKPTSTKAPVASTCACAPAKRDALAQDSYCQASTVTVSSVSTITQTATVYPSSSVGSVSSVEAIASYSVSTSVVTSTVTAEVTQTVTATVTVTPSLSAPTSAAAVATSSSSKCTTSITLTRSSTGSVVAPVGTGATFPYPSANATTAAPTAPSVSLAPVYSSALANLTSALATGALTSVVPSASVNPILSSYIANLTSILPTGVLPTGTIPTALPSGYASVTAAPTASAPAYGGSNQAPASGMTLQQILDWLAYIVKQVFQQGEKAGKGAAAPAASSSSAVAAAAATPGSYEKRNHARSFMG